MQDKGKTPPGRKGSTGQAQRPDSSELLLDDQIEDDPAFGLPNFFLSTKKVRGANNAKGGRFQKSNALVHNNPQIAMTVMQQKLINILLRNAQQNASIPESDVRWKISFAEMTAQLGITTRNVTHIEKTINQMMSIKVRWNVMEGKGLAKNFAVVFPYAKLEQGQMTYEVQSQVIELLRDYQSYTSLNLREISKLSKMSSIPLYEMASRYLNIGASRWIKWEQLRDMLVSADNIPKSAQTWIPFNNRYIKPAIEDINALTDILVRVEYKKANRKITHVKIFVSKKKNELDNVAGKSKSADKFEMQGELLAIGFREKSASILMSQYSMEEIKLAISFTKKRLEATHLKALLHPDRYLSNVLKNKLYLEPASFTTGQTIDLFKTFSTPTAHQAATKNQNPGRQQMVELVNMQRKNDVKIILSEMDKMELLDLYDEYNANLKTKSLCISDGKNRPGVVAAFQEWYSKRLYGEITDKEIVETLARNYQQS